MYLAFCIALAAFVALVIRGERKPERHYRRMLVQRRASNPAMCRRTKVYLSAIKR
jgi:predicted RNase H-like nuclease